jgi:hypothetical protein
MGDILSFPETMVFKSWPGLLHLFQVLLDFFNTHPDCRQCFDHVPDNQDQAEENNNADRPKPLTGNQPEQGYDCTDNRENDKPVIFHV